MSVGERVVAWSRAVASVVARALGAPFQMRQDPLTARMEVGEWDGEDSRTIQDLRPGRGWGWACRPWRVADQGGAGPGGSGSPLFPRALPEAKRAPPPPPRGPRPCLSTQVAAAPPVSPEPRLCPRSWSPAPLLVPTSPGPPCASPCPSPGSWFSPRACLQRGWGWGWGPAPLLLRLQQGLSETAVKMRPCPRPARTLGVSQVCLAWVLPGQLSPMHLPGSPPHTRPR